MTLEVKLWTNRELKKGTRLFMNTVVNTSGDQTTEIGAKACTERRRKFCVERERCQRFEPKCEWDRNGMVGLPRVSNSQGLNNSQYREREDKIAKVLEKEFEKCREIVLSIKES